MHCEHHKTPDHIVHPILYVGCSTDVLRLRRGMNNASRVPLCALRTARCSAGGGRPVRKPKGYWSDIDNLKHELIEVQKTSAELRDDCMPTARELRSIGRRDLDNAITKTGGYRRVAELLGLASSSNSRPRGYWNDFKNLQAEMRGFLREYQSHFRDGIMPTQKELRALRRSDIVEAIQKHGGSAAVAERLGLAQRSPKKSRHYWKDWSLVEREIRAFVATRDGPRKAIDEPELMVASREASQRLLPKSSKQRMPSQKELRAAGRADLAEAITDHHGGFREVAKRLGYRSRKKDDFFYDNFYNVAREVYQVVLNAGTESIMPSTTLLKAVDRSDLAAAIAKYGGMSDVSQRLGLQYKVRTREAFKDWGLFRRNLMSFMETHGTPGEIPSSRALNNFGRRDLYQAILHHGGSRAVADKMGLKRNYWQDFSNVGMQVLEFVDTHGTDGIMPTEREFHDVGRSALNVAVSKFGHSQVAKRLGLTEPPQSVQNALDASLNQSASLSESCCERCEDESKYLL